MSEIQLHAFTLENVNKLQLITTTFLITPTLSLPVDICKQCKNSFHMIHFSSIIEVLLNLHVLKFDPFILDMLGKS